MFRTERHVTIHVVLTNNCIVIRCNDRQTFCKPPTCHFIIPPWRCLKKAVTCRRFTTCLCIILSKYSAVCNVLMTNEMHNSYNQLLLHSFLSALHISNKTSRSSSGAGHSILYYTVWYNRALCLLYMFRTNLVVHRQEQGTIYCITQFGKIVL